jgi:putative membrane protein
MKTTPYSKFDPDELILRDVLAIDRTLLANERTLLAYLRSGVALVIAGISIINFAEQAWFLAVGIACIPIGILTGLLGTLRFLRMNAAISHVRQQVRSGSGKSRT